MSRMAGLSRRGATALSMALLAAVLALGCGEDGGVVVTEIDPRAARPFVVSVLDIGQRRYTLGDEISATFSKHHGWRIQISIGYGGEDRRIDNSEP